MNDAHALLIGANEDHTFRHTVSRVRELGLNADVLPLREFLDGATTRSVSGNLEFRYGTQTFRISSYRVIYHRMILDRHLLGRLTPRKLRLYQILVSCICNASNAEITEVINPLRRDDANASKLLQLMALKSFGFHTPQSLVTNEPDVARRFVSKHGDCIYKSCSSIRSIVSQTPPVDSGIYETLRNSPVLFQERIVGVDIRVHGVGNQFFAEQIESSMVDYRYSEDNLHCQVDVPRSIKSKLLKYMKHSNLLVVGVDFKKCSQTGDWVILEVNTLPGYSGYDQRSGGRISESLVQLIAQHSNEAMRSDQHL